jgi:hypothetical protein
VTDAEMDARVAELTDADLRLLAAGRATPDRLEYYRPALLLRRLAGEVLRLRAAAGGRERGATAPGSEVSHPGE